MPVMKRVKFSFNPYNVDRIALAVAAAGVRDTEYFEATRGRIMATRKRFTAAMEKMGFNIPDSKTNFVFAGSGRIAGADYFHELRKRNIIVRYFDKDPIRDYVRITIGTDEDMDLLLKATEEILKEAGK